MDLPLTALFLIAAVTVAWPLVARLSLSAPEKLVVLPALSLLATFILGWFGYVVALSPAVYAVLPLAAVAGVATHFPAARRLLGDRDVRSILISQSIVTIWCAGWLMLIASYSGGGWSGDWLEHWQRTVFFARQGPRDTLFLGLYPLTARPPLANVVTSVILSAGNLSFAQFQFTSTVLASLVFLPCALLANRFGAPNRSLASPVNLLALLFLVNPCFVQNATFAWTKLPTAFFVLQALYFFLRSQDHDAPKAATTLWGTAIAAALITHYSAAIYAVILAVAWLALHRARWHSATTRRQLLTLVGVVAAVLSLWFGWSLATYGAASTFLSNTSVSELDPRAAQQLWKIILNVRDTVVPHFLRDLDSSLIQQRNPWSYWRDWFFQLYQLNLWFVWGSIGAAVLLKINIGRWRQMRGTARRAWCAGIVTAIVLGIAVHGARDQWGLVHICLQPLVLLGLTCLAAQASGLAMFWRRLLVVGAAVDLLAGIALHIVVQSFAIEEWLGGPVIKPDWFNAYSESFVLNLRVKTLYGLKFLRESLPCPPALVLAVLLAVLIVAVVRARRTFARPA